MSANAPQNTSQKQAYRKPDKNTVIDTFIAPPCLDKIHVIYQDSDILVINKPSGLLSLSGKNPLNNDSVHFRLVQKFATPWLVHRLDFGTSGIMLVALNKSSNALLAKQFQQRSIDKTYDAILYGHVSTRAGKIEQPIAKDPALFPKLKICEKTGKASSTLFKVVEYIDTPRSTRISFKPLTGRTHQLRIHSEHIGHPILGCDLYGIEHSFQQAKRLLLHAKSLKFIHPTSGKTMTVNCPTPF